MYYEFIRSLFSGTQKPNSVYNDIHYYFWRDCLDSGIIIRKKMISIWIRLD